MDSGNGVRHVLRSALEIVRRDHTGVQLAVDAQGVKCRPLDPEAVSWSSVGALIKVAPSGLPAPAAEHNEDGWQAFLLLQDAAEAMGYLSTAAVDVMGPQVAQQMFWRALHAAGDPEPPKRTIGSRGTGTHPRGAAA